MSIKKVFFIACCFLAIHYNSIAQNTEFGFQLTPRDTINVLLVFAEVDCGPCPESGKCSKEFWPQSLNPHPEKNNWLDTGFVGGQATAFLTDYYHQMSSKTYFVFGDYVEDIVTIPCNQFSNRFDMVEEVLKALDNNPNSFPTARGLDIDDFDHWGSQGPGVQKNKGADGTIDVINIVWRNYGGFGECGGLGVQDFSFFIPPVTIKGKSFKVIGSYNGCNGTVEKDAEFFIAEYFHALLGSNNFHTGSGASSWTFMSEVGSFALSAQSGSASNVANGWDRQRLGWKEPTKQFLTSALDISLNEIPTDTFLQRYPNGGKFILRDFVSTGDAIQIKLPNINAPIKNQYLWLENHQRVSRFDKARFEDDGCQEPWSKGLYAYIQVGKDNKTSFGGLANWFMPLQADGNLDFTYRIDLKDTPNVACVWKNKSVPIEKATSKSNPFTGMNDAFNLFDYNEDGKLRSGDDWQPWYSEVINQQLVNNASHFGDASDAFNSINGNKLSIATNPAPVPVYTLRNIDGFPRTIEPLPAGFDNRTIFLNGLSVEITGENVDGNGAIELTIKWDDYLVDNDVRWCGNIVLKNDALDPLSRQNQIILDNNKSILLDQGLSPTRPLTMDTLDDGTFLFAEPTILTLDSGTKTIIKPGGELRVVNGSTLRIKSGAIIEVQGDGQIVIENGAYLCIDTGTIIFLKDAQSQLIVEEFATLGTNPKLLANNVPVGISNCLTLCDIKNIIIASGSLGTLNRTYLANAGLDITSCTTITGDTLGGKPTADPNRGIGPFTYSWIPTTNIDDPTKANPIIISPISTQKAYTVTVTDANGCVDSDDMTVFVNNPNPPFTLPFNADLEIVVGGNPDTWNPLYVTNESEVLENSLRKMLGVSFSNTSITDPAPNSGCYSAKLPLNEIYPSYLLHVNEPVSMTTNDVYMMEVQIKVENNTTATDEKLDISLINEYLVTGPSSSTPGGPQIRQLELKQSFDLKPAGGINPLLEGWQTFRQCLPSDVFYPNNSSLRRAIRVETEYSPVTDLDVRIDAFRFRPITTFIDPVSNQFYVQNNFSAPNNFTFDNPLYFYVRNITGIDFPNASSTRQVYNFQQISPGTSNPPNVFPTWNILSDYNWIDPNPIEINGIISLQPFTHITLKDNSGKFTLGENSKLCMAQGSEFILKEGSNLELAGGELQLMFPNACLGVFGGKLSVAPEQSLNINKGFLFLQQTGEINIANNSKILISSAGQLVYESGSKIVLNRNNKFTFQKGSNLKLSDDENNNVQADKRLNFILNCGNLNALWEGQELIDNLKKLNVYHSWESLIDCPLKKFKTDTLKIATTLNKNPVFNSNLDFSDESNVLINGAGLVQFSLPPSFPPVGAIVTEEKAPPVIIVGSNTSLLLRSNTVLGSFLASAASTTNEDVLVIKSSVILDSNSITSFTDATTLVVPALSTLLIRGGANLTLKKHAKIVIESGAFLCIEEGATIMVEGDAQFIVDANAIKGSDPLLGINSNCQSSLNLPFAQFNFIQKTCGISGIIVDGTASENLDQYTWKVTELESGLLTEETFISDSISSLFDFTGGNFGGGINFQAGVFYEIELIVNNGSFASSSKQIVQINPNLKVSDDITICLSDSAQLFAEAGTNIIYQWTPSLFLNFANIANPVAQPDSTITYTVSAEDSLGCIASADVTIEVLRPFEVVTIAGTGVDGFVNGDAKTDVEFSFPANIAPNPDGTKLYIADEQNHVIRVLELETNEVSTLAGTGTAGFTDGDFANAQFNEPKGIVVDDKGIIYVADAQNHSIRRLNPEIGNITTIAGTGVLGYADSVGTNAQFNYPQSIGMDIMNRTLYIADAQNNVLRKMTPTTFFDDPDQSDEWIVTTLAGTGTAGFKNGDGSIAQFNNPTGVAFQGGVLYVADKNNHRIRSVNTATKNVSNIAGTGYAGFLDGDTAIAKFKFPKDVAIDFEGNIYVSDRENNKIRKIDPVTNMVSTVSTIAGVDPCAGSKGGEGINEAQFNHPEGLAFDPTENILYIADRDNHIIRKDLVGSGLCPVVTPPSFDPLFHVNRISSYVLLGINQVRMDKESRVVIGAVGGQTDLSKVSLEKGVDINGLNSFVAANEVEIEEEAIVTDAFVNNLDNEGTIPGAVYPYAAPLVTLPGFPLFSAGTLDIVVEEGDTLTLAPGNYGKIEVEKEAQLYFSGGEYNIIALEAERNSMLLFNDVSVLKIKDEIELDKEVVLMPNSPDIDARDIIIFVEGLDLEEEEYSDKKEDDDDDEGDEDDEDEDEDDEDNDEGEDNDDGCEDDDDNGNLKVDFDRNVIVKANLFAPNSRMKVDKEAFLEGSFIAEEICIDKEVTLQLLATCWDDFIIIDSVVISLIQLQQSSGSNNLLAYPNPFSNGTTISFSLNKDSKVSLEVYNGIRQKVASLYQGDVKVGQLNTAVFNAEGNNSAGLYYVVLKSNGNIMTKKIILIN